MFVLVDVQVLLSYVYRSCFSPVELEAVLPKVKDHVKLAVTFPLGSTVANSFSKVGISCQLEFNSIKPISMSDYIVIRDKTSNVRYIDATPTKDIIIIIYILPQETDTFYDRCRQLSVHFLYISNTKV